jgi:hypothetical protein
VVAGFFLPWVHGSAEFASRDFTGFDLARLVRNFEIVASSSQEAGGFRLTAIVIYLAPALAVNGAALAWIAASPRISAAALLFAAVYAAVVLFGVAFLSIISWTELQRVLGGLMAGFGCTAAGAMALLGAGLMLAHERATPDS